jgi:hypothetical protein
METRYDYSCRTDKNDSNIPPPKSPGGGLKNYISICLIKNCYTIIIKNMFKPPSGGLGGSIRIYTEFNSLLL